MEKSPVNRLLKVLLIAGLLGFLLVILLVWRGREELKGVTQKALKLAEQAAGPSGRVTGLKREGSSLIIRELSGRGVKLWNVRTSIKPIDWLKKPETRSVNLTFDSLRVFAWTLAHGRGVIQVRGEASAVEIDGELTAAGNRIGPLHVSSGLALSKGIVLRSAVVTSPLFQFDYDSVLILESGTIRATGRTGVETTLLSPFPVPKKLGLAGRIDLSGVWQFRENRMAGDFGLKSSKFDIGPVSIRELAGRLILGQGRVTVPEYSGLAFGGSLKGRARGESRVRDKSILIVADIKDADLDQMPSKPEGLAFKGKYHGRIEISAHGKSWDEVVDKIRESGE